MLQTDLKLPYLYKEAQIETHDKPRLLLLIHGFGSNEQDLFSFATELPNDFFIASVQAPNEIQYGGYAWYDINFVDLQKMNNLDQAKQSIELLRNFIHECIQKHDLNPDEVWLCGFSQGAILSYALALQNQQNIRRVIGLSGYPAPDILGNEFQKEYKDLSFFISHGTEDAVIPIRWAQKGKDLLTQLKIPFTYKEYQSGHGVVPQNFYDLLHWINEMK